MVPSNAVAGGLHSLVQERRPKKTGFSFRVATVRAWRHFPTAGPGFAAVGSALISTSW